MTEHHRLVIGEWALAIAALVQRRFEAERGEDPPRTGDRGIARVAAGRDGDAIERVDRDVKEIRVRVLLREAEEQLGERRCATEAIEVEPDLGPRPREIERGEGVEVAAR